MLRLGRGNLLRICVIMTVGIAPRFVGGTDIVMEDYCNKDAETKVTVPPVGPASSTKVVLSRRKSGQPLDEHCLSTVTFQTEPTHRLVVVIDKLHLPIINDVCPYHLEIKGLVLGNDTETSLFCKTRDDGHQTALRSLYHGIDIIWDTRDKDNNQSEMPLPSDDGDEDDGSRALFEEEQRTIRNALKEATFRVIITSYQEADEMGKCVGEHAQDQLFKCGNDRCIDQRWKCDGVNNCGDMSDEPPNCPTTTGLSDTAIVFIILAVFLVVIVTGVAIVLLISRTTSSADAQTPARQDSSAAEEETELQPLNSDSSHDPEGKNEPGPSTDATKTTVPTPPPQEIRPSQQAAPYDKRDYS